MRRNNKIVIFGLYKTGTTALFQKIRYLLPKDTRYLFEKLEYVPETQDAQRCVLAKVILDNNPAVASKSASFFNFDKKIVIVRDPRDWLVSKTLFMVQAKPSIYNNEHTFNHILQLVKAKQKSPTQIPLTAILEPILQAPPAMTLDEVKHWIASVLQYLIDFEMSLTFACRVHYEDFIDGNTRHLEQYLGLEFPLMEPRLENWQAHVPRTKAYGDWHNWLLAEDIAHFSQVFSAYIKHYGYDTDWNISERPVILATNAADYITRTVSMRRNAHS